MMADLNRKTDLNSEPVNRATDEAIIYEDTHAADPQKPRLVQSIPSKNPAAAQIRETGVPGTGAPRDWDETDLPPASTTYTGSMNTTASPLLSDNDIGNLRSRWSSVQAGFVDEPRRSVEQADQLVATVMQRLAEGFANERAGLEKQWDRGEDVSTEDLRIALQRYRAFFGRLLNAA
jgi:hypothetical protein